MRVLQAEKNPTPATVYYVWNSENITIDISLVIVIVVSESKELWPLNQAAFWRSDRLHSIA